jgi:hypothetical protein
MGETAPPGAGAGPGTGNFCPRGDGDGKPFPDGEIPVAIPKYDRMSIGLRLTPAVSCKSSCPLNIEVCQILYPSNKRL